MKGPYPQACWFASQHSSHTLAHLTGSTIREGYLVTGNQQYAECINGESQVWQYAPGGYFYRPADTINGGPESLALTQSIWIMRETSEGVTKVWPSCIAQETEQQP